MMLNYVVPPIIIRQCDDRDDGTCAQILYRTMVFAGPASKEDCLQMMDILTKPRVVEISKLHDAMIQFRLARSRLRNYGHTEPEPSQLFETLKVAASALTEKDQELQFRFQHYLMKHSSVNGLVSEQTVQDMYDMIVENARSFVDAPSAADAKALQSRNKDRKKPYEQAAVRNQTDFACFGCGSKDHWFKDCPHRQAIQQQVAQQYQNQPQQQNLPNKNQGKVQPKAQPQKKGDKGKGKGKKGKDDAKNQAQKGKGRARVRPGARAVDWDDNQEYPDEDYGYDFPTEDQEQ